MCVLFILNLYDCYLNLGFRILKFLCGECGKVVKWLKIVLFVVCIECEIWYYKDCFGVNIGIYLFFEKNLDLSWYCC